MQTAKCPLHLAKMVEKGRGEGMRKGTVSRMWYRQWEKRSSEGYQV